MRLLLDNLATLADSPNGILKLRELILQLAVRGKLVAQDPNDEPGFELLMRIRNRQKEMIDSGEIRKVSDVTPPKNQERPFDLPLGWAWAGISEIAAILDYRRDPVNKTERLRRVEGKKESELFPYYGATSQVGFIDDYIFDDTLILLGEDGAPFLEPGKTKSYIIRGKSWVNNHAHVLKLLMGCEEFYCGYLNIYDYAPLVYGMTRLKLNQSKMCQIMCPVPPLPEQKRIVAKVDELMTLCDQLEKQQEERRQTRVSLNKTSLHALTTASRPADFRKHWKRIADHFDLLYDTPETVTELKQAILQLAVQGKLVPQNPKDEPAGELLKRIKAEKEKLLVEGKIRKEKPLAPIADSEIPFDLPEGWEWTRLQNAGLLLRGKSKHRPRNDRKLFVNGVYPLVQTGDVANSKNTGYQIKTYTSKYNEVGLAQSKMWNAGTLCITIAANIAEVGFLSFDACFPDSVVGFLTLNNTCIPKYVQTFIIVSKSDLESFAPSTAQKNINLGILNSMIFPIPPLAEQKRIVAKVGALLTLCNHLETTLRHSQATAQNLMQAMVQEIIATA